MSNNISRRESQPSSPASPHTPQTQTGSAPRLQPLPVTPASQVLHTPDMPPAPPRYASEIRELQRERLAGRAHYPTLVEQFRMAPLVPPEPQQQPEREPIGLGITYQTPPPDEDRAEAGRAQGRRTPEHNGYAGLDAYEPAQFILEQQAAVELIQRRFLETNAAIEVGAIEAPAPESETPALFLEVDAFVFEDDADPRR